MRKSLKSAFTLVELLVVIGLMAMLATVSIGGYNAATRGMEERGAKDSVISLIRMAQQRAMIDNAPTAVFFFNQRLRDDSGEDGGHVVGKAVAVRMAGRISYADGQFISDEFGDWENSYPVVGTSSDPEMNLYRMTNAEGGINSCRSQVTPYVTAKNRTEYMISCNMNTNVTVYCLEVKGGASGWKVGDPYGFEIGELQLPKNYVFGSSVPSNMEAEHTQTVLFDPQVINIYSTDYFSFSPVTISTYRQGSGGGMSVKKLDTVATSDIRQN
jgi:prepilin-type N-terminal cleavage/methylation domain-containing protein